MSLLEVSDLTVSFRTRSGELNAVEDLCFSLEKGEILGIAGESGSGKTVTALALIGLLPRPGCRVSAGRILFDGQDLLGLPERRMRRIRGPGIAMVFQEPMTSLNPVFTVGEQIMETILAHEPVSRATAFARAVKILETVGIASASARMSEYPHRLSGGQRQRVMLAIALACRPRLLIADEPTTALDVTIQAQILELLLDLRDAFAMAIIVITHNMGVIAETADTVLVMYAGRAVEQAPAARLFDAPLHPYTRGLLACVPGPGPERDRLAAMPGNLPEPSCRPDGCRFSPRCPHATPACRQSPPRLQLFEANHAAACIRIGDIG